VSCAAVGSAFGSKSVDIVIDNFNYARFLGAAIDSALAQSAPAARVIVVDDGSTDSSRELIASYGERILPVLKENGGQASAFNAGFAHSEADVVIFLDSDDELLPNAAGATVAAFDAEPRAAKVQYRMEVIDGSGSATGAVKPPPHLRMPSGDVSRHELVLPFDLPWLPTSGNAFAASVLRRIFPIPEHEFHAGADWYLQHLTPLFGPVVSLDEVAARYRVHGANSYEPAAAVLDLGHVRKAVVYAAATRRELERVADELALQRPRGGTLSVADIANRMISLKLDPERHPLPGESIGGLLARGVRAAGRRFDASPPLRLLFMAWFVSFAVAPRALARRLAERFLFPERRPRLNRVLRLLHAPGS
jgi:hypothetical protein